MLKRWDLSLANRQCHRNSADLCVGALCDASPTFKFKAGYFMVLVCAPSASLLAHEPWCLVALAVGAAVRISSDDTSSATRFGVERSCCFAGCSCRNHDQLDLQLELLAGNDWWRASCRLCSMQPLAAWNLRGNSVPAFLAWAQPRWAQPCWRWPSAGAVA